MTTIMVDPLAAFMRGHLSNEERWPVPLVSTSFDVSIEAGLAVVETRRVFSNTEDHAIEAALSFPVPIHATFYHLEAQIDGRTIKAVAQARSSARANYEAAVGRGKAAALHEELMPGIHMLSLANIMPGCDIEVLTRWAMPLTFVSSKGHLRIPLTVGDIYGRSGLSETDDLALGGKAGTAQLSVQTSGERVTLGQGSDAPFALKGEPGCAEVPLDRPINLYVSKWARKKLQGLAGDGQYVSLTLAPEAQGVGNIDAAVLVDRSGSMTGQCSPDGDLTVYEAARRGLRQLGEQLGIKDRVELWEFASRPTRVGTLDCGDVEGSVEQRFDQLISNLNEPGGGTETGVAISAVLGSSPVPDVIVITDGKSHALDVDNLAKGRRRISAILIGEDSLEARLGHLVAETGGHMFIASGEDIGRQLQALLSTLRQARVEHFRQRKPLAGAQALRNNVKMVAAWGEEDIEAAQNQLLSQAAVAAAAAAIALPMLKPKEAEALAIRDGLITRRTSLLLIDEAGEAQAGLPAFRKVRLPRSAVVSSSRMMSFASHEMVFNSPPESRIVSLSEAPPRPRFARRNSFMERLQAEHSSPDSARISLSRSKKPRISERIMRTLGLGSGANAEDLRFILNAEIMPLLEATKIDWGSHASELLGGDASSLPVELQTLFLWLYSHQSIEALANMLGQEPNRVLIGLAALCHSGRDRHAQRLAAFLLGDWQQKLPKAISEVIAQELVL